MVKLKKQINNRSSAGAETGSKRSSRSVAPGESDQVRYMRGASVERLVSSKNCGFCLISSNRQPRGSRASEWEHERETGRELKWQAKNGILALSLNLNHRALLQPELVSEPHPVSVLGPASTPWQLRSDWALPSMEVFRMGSGSCSPGLTGSIVDYCRGVGIRG